MTVQEAKVILEAEIKHHPEHCIFHESLAVAIKALEKQTAEKVIVWADNTEHCPFCEKDLTALGYLKYCNDCGQKLDWSEV